MSEELTDALGSRSALHQWLRHQLQATIVEDSDAMTYAEFVRATETASSEHGAAYLASVDAGLPCPPAAYAAWAVENLVGSEE